MTDDSQSNPSGSQIRLFVALEMPEPVARAVAGVQQQLRGKPYLNARFTPRANLHLTLKFLGEQPEEELAAIDRALAGLAHPAFQVSLGETGVFASRGLLRIIWVHLGGDGVLSLQQAVDRALAPRFEPEAQFMSHLTIARIKNVSNRQLLLEDLAGMRPPTVTFPVNRFVLKQSTLGPDGPVYRTLHTYSLGGPRT